MKNRSKIIALLLVLVALVVAYFLLKGGTKATPGTDAQPSPTDTQTSPTPDVALDVISPIGLAKADINKILLKRDTGDIILTLKETEVESQVAKEDGTTTTTKQMVNLWVTDQFSVDSAAVDNIAFAAENATTSRFIEADPKDLSIYGLDKPSTVTFYSADGQEKSIEIGSATPTGNDYYIRVGGDKAVYTLLTYYANTFLLGKYDIMSRQLYPKEGMVGDNITDLTFYKGKDIVFESHLVTAPAKWGLIYPLVIEADYTDLAKFLEGLAGLYAFQIIEQNPSDLKVYGLDKPQYTFLYTLDGKRYALKIGSMSGTLYYAMFEGNDIVFSVDSTILSFVGMPLIDVVDLLIYVPSIFDVSKLVIEIDGRVDVLNMDVTKELSETDVYEFNGKKIEGEENRKLYRRYYQGAIALMGDKIDVDAKPEGEAFARLTYTAKTGFVNERTTVIEFIPTPDDYGYYVMKNDVYTGMIMGKRQLDTESMGFRQSYKNLMNALNAK